MKLLIISASFGFTKQLNPIQQMTALVRFHRRLHWKFMPFCTDATYELSIKMSFYNRYLCEWSNRHVKIGNDTSLFQSFKIKEIWNCNHKNLNWILHA